MRWDSLFDDLETQLEQGMDAEEGDLRAEEERLRLGRLTLRDRIGSVHASYGRRDDYVLQLRLVSGTHVPVRVATLGLDWLSGDIRDGAPLQRQCVIPLSAVAALSLSREQVRRSLAIGSDPEARRVTAGVSLPTVLRDLCRRRSPLEAVTMTDTVFGTIDRVGGDHFDLAVHEADGPRRDTAVSDYRVIAVAGLAMIRL